MKSPRLFPVLFLFFALFSLAAQEGAGEQGALDAGDSQDVIIPLSLLMDAARSPEILWRPDWPLEILPGSFSVSGGAVRSVTLETADGKEYRARRHASGVWEEFPFLFQGALYPAQTRLDASGVIQGFSVDMDSPVEFEFLRFEDGEPALIRVQSGGSYYFAALQYQEGAVTETWFDTEGSALSYFAFRQEFTGGRRRFLEMASRTGDENQTETYGYDSFGNVSSVVSGEGSFSAVYAAPGKPRYWERVVKAPPAEEAGDGADAGTGGGAAASGGGTGDAPDSGDGGGEQMVRSSYTLQWDEGGFLTRLSGGADGGGDTDFRYSYDLDGRGNWETCRALPMLRRPGILVPGPYSAFSRIIGYTTEAFP